MAEIVFGARCQQSRSRSKFLNDCAQMWHSNDIKRHFKSAAEAFRVKNEENEGCRGGTTEELQKYISGRTEEGFLAGEPARGFGASRRPSGDVRFTGSPARYGARTFGRCFASTLHHRNNIAVQSHTKVSTLNQALTLFPPH